MEVVSLVGVSTKPDSCEIGGERLLQIRYSDGFPALGMECESLKGLEARVGIGRFVSSQSQQLTETKNGRKRANRSNRTLVSQFYPRFRRTFAYVGRV